MDAHKKMAVILKHPAFIAFILGTLILLVLPDYFNKHDVVVSKPLKNMESYQNCFYDLDGDGAKERIQYGNDDNSKRAMYIIYINTHSIVDQYNWKGEYMPHTRLAFGDYDHNGLSEIYSFTVHTDSIFINGMEYQSERKVLDNVFVRKINTYQGKPDFRIQFGSIESPFLDMDNDGFDELIFNYNALFSGIPRMLYSCNIQHGTFYKSDVTGANLHLNMVFNTNKKVLICGGGAPGNNRQHPGYFLHDYSAWLVAYSTDLKVEKIAKEVPEMNSNINAFFYDAGDTSYLFSLSREIREIKRRFTLSLLDTSLKAVKSKVYTTALANNVSIIMANQKLYMYEGRNSNKIFKVDNDLNRRLVYRHHDNIPEATVLDIENDGTQEIVVSSAHSNELTILSDGFRHKTVIPNVRGKVQALHNGKNELAILGYDNELAIATYKDNPYYYAKIPFYVLVYVVIFLATYYTQKYRKLKLAAANQQLLHLQLRALKNQIDPHFTFNVINSISMVIAKGSVDTAQRYFGQFSSLLRDILDYSDRVMISLDGEIGITKKYLELEKIRFKEKVNFRFDIDEQADLSMPIPRMLLQHHVENAIKHGLMHKKVPGNILVSAKVAGAGMKITVEDDGIGRKASSALKRNGTGKGSSINNQLIGLYQQVYQVKIQFGIEDLTTADLAPAGTRVTFIIPQKT